jgi:[acyl-carrier-protein] S-malonyltransferase
MGQTGSQPTTAIFFPGQGTQRVGMVQDFVDTFPEARQTLERVDEILKFPLSKIIREGPPVCRPDDSG